MRGFCLIQSGGVISVWWKGLYVGSVLERVETFLSVLQLHNHTQMNQFRYPYVRILYPNNSPFPLINTYLGRTQNVSPI